MKEQYKPTIELIVPELSRQELEERFYELHKQCELKYTKDQLIFAIQEAYGHGRSDEHAQVDESISAILQYIDENQVDSENTVSNLSVVTNG